MYTLKEAAEAVGLTKPAIFKAIKKGSISANKDERGQWIIDPAELHRIYKPINQTENRIVSSLREETAIDRQSLRAENDNLRAERERERSQLQETIADLRYRLDQSEAERREAQGKLTALLTYQPEQKAQTTPEPTAKKSRLLEKLFGRDKAKV
jgi:excisionase family DNA binding protein